MALQKLGSWSDASEMGRADFNWIEYSPSGTGERV